MKVIGFTGNFGDEGCAPQAFLMADSSILYTGRPFFIPDFAQRFVATPTIIVRMGRLGKCVAPKFAHRYWDAVTVGIDFTARDTQEKARHEGMPWTICKGFDGSAAIGTFQPLSLEGKGAGIGFRLDKNGETVQQGDSSEMLFSVDEIISYLSRFFTLRTGDLIYTGTPAGIGAVKPGDHLQGYIGEDCVLDFYCR